MKHLNEEYTDRLFIRADELILEGEIAEAKDVLLRILEEDPTYGRAHNHLGWICTHKLVDLERAEMHLKLALKYASGYAASARNYAIYLLEANKLDELIEFVDGHLDKLGADWGMLYALKGNALEIKGQLRAALKSYKRSRIASLDTGFIAKLDEDIDRVKVKMTLLYKFAALF